MIYKVDNLLLSLDAPGDALRMAVCKKLGIRPAQADDITLFRRSVDARRGNVRWNCSVMIKLDTDQDIPGAEKWEEPVYSPARPGDQLLQHRPVIIGAGPAGTFAALVLAQQGYRPVIFERGDDVDTRRSKVERFFAGGILDADCNVQFGEGGAGTFSDGKLMTRIKDPRCHEVLRLFVRHGASKDILVEAKPHIGSDMLVDIARSMRREIERLGGSYRFGCRVEDLVLRDGKISGVRLLGGEEIPTQTVILAVGNSARELFERLYEQGVPMEAKPFAVGMRVEHPREMVDGWRYGRYAGDTRLGAAEYHLAVRVGARNVYSFCMCPGGFVINSSSEDGYLCVNGMSLSGRDAQNSNAALVVSVGPEDFGKQPLDGLRFQREIERKAFSFGYRATAQRMEDFLSHRENCRFGGVQPSVLPGAVAGDAAACLPEYVQETLRQALPLLERQLPGFLLPDAVLTAAETRTSSPVRILRDAQTLQSAGAQGLYPAGEGAGYAGGITSAAVDGMRAAEELISQWRVQE